MRVRGFALQVSCADIIPRCSRNYWVIITHYPPGGLIRMAWFGLALPDCPRLLRKPSTEVSAALPGCMTSSRRRCWRSRRYGPESWRSPRRRRPIPRSRPSPAAKVTVRCGFRPGWSRRPPRRGSPRRYPCSLCGRLTARHCRPTGSGRAGQMHAGDLRRVDRVLRFECRVAAGGRE